MFCVRVALCLQSDSSLCGDYQEYQEAAGHHWEEDRDPVSQLSAAQGENWLVAVVVGVLVTLLASLLVLVKCCWCSSARRQQKMTAAEREKQLMLRRPDILHPIDEKMLELAQMDGDPRQVCAHHRSGLYSNNKTGGESPALSQDSLWWRGQAGGAGRGEVCGCQGGVRDAQSLPHLASPELFRHRQSQYYSQGLLYGTMPRKIIREIIV